MFRHLKTSFMSRKDFIDITDGVHATLKKVVPPMIYHNTNDFMKNNLPRAIAKAIKPNIVPSHVDLFLRDYMTNHILHVHPTSFASSTILDLQHQLYLKMKDDEQAQQADISIWLSLKIKFERSTPLLETCRAATVCTRNHDDHHDDDAYPEEESSAKR
ncbi:hypothetical protein Tco_0730537 [Tanacetum coccineum]|uniref:Uncharacterized protein n=1 Tax=Tanacetum coccineum TaxID=301880 RepID=A0ABQ4YUJ7_9ASTR